MKILNNNSIIGGPRGEGEVTFNKLLEKDLNLHLVSITFINLTILV